MIACAMASRPPAPSPWKARNEISWTMFCERPHSIDPATNTTNANWKTTLRPRRSLTFP